MAPSRKGQGQGQGLEPGTGAHVGLERIRQHLFGELLPLWHEHGVDRVRGGFFNGLEPDGGAQDDAFKRVLVQTRQTWVWSRTARMGGPDFCRANAEHGFEFLMRHCWDPKTGGWLLTTTGAGESLDATRQCYGHAFAMLGLGEYFALTGEAAARERALETLELLDAHLVDPVHGGYFDSAEPDWQPARAPRSQNPHMHLLEALLALFEQTGEAGCLERAGDLARLFAERLFAPASGTLGEVFAADWSGLPGEEGARVEPGHHFEWVWLLAELERVAPDLAAQHDTSGHARRLLDFAERFGVDAEAGGVFDAVDRGGRVLRSSKRLWPQTERVQAWAARTLAGDAEAPAPLRASTGSLLRSLRVRPDGRGWHERLAADGRVSSAELRATSLYHVVGALDRAARALESVTAG